MQRGWEREVVRYPFIALAAQAKLSQVEPAEELGLSVRQVRRLVRRYRESGGQLGSLAIPPQQRPRPPTRWARSHWACAQSIARGEKDHLGRVGRKTEAVLLPRSPRRVRLQTGGERLAASGCDVSAALQRRQRVTRLVLVADRKVGVDLQRPL